MLRSAALAGLIMASSTTFAQAQPPADPPSIAELARCQQVQDSAARLTCFDQAAAALVAASRQGDVAIVNREQVRTARRSLFGFPIGKLPFFGGGDEAKEEAEPKELETTLASMSSLGLNRYRITVQDGGAVWETTESAPLRRSDRGTKVKIRRGALGSYFVRVGSEQWVRARRLR